MLNKIIAFLVKRKLGKAALTPIGRGLRKIKGAKTEILLGLLAAVYALEVAGVVPAGAMDEAKVALGAAAVPTLLEKVKDNEEIVKALLEAAEESLQDSEEK